MSSHKTDGQSYFVLPFTLKKAFNYSHQKFDLLPREKPEYEVLASIVPL